MLTQNTEKRRIVVPPDFAYGKRGRAPHIPGWATLVFEAQLMHIQQIDWSEQARKAQLAEEEKQEKRDELRSEHWERDEKLEQEKKKAEEEEKKKAEEEEEKKKAEEEKKKTEDRNEVIEELGDIKDEL